MAKIVSQQINPKHPDRWEWVVQCERKGVESVAPFKQIILKCCDDRNGSWSREVPMHCQSVQDLAAVHVQYHVHC